jgi:peptidoglycan/LPS O-acetylase OafA/YrhL
LNKKIQEKNYFPFLDLLRYFCAVSVLIWHYQHFFLLSPDNVIPNFNIEDQPFWSLLSIPYKTGFNAVPLFWVLSGVVLSKSYLSADIKSIEFFVNRFARLYPLHFATLILITIIQFFSTHLVGHSQIYKDNSLAKFFGNLILMNDGSSFNAPVWSVSVEILSYIVFALLVLRQKLRVLFCFCIILLSCALSQTQFPQSSFLQLNQISKCALYFFCGVCLFFLIEKIPAYLLSALAISFFLFGLYYRNNSYFILTLGLVLSFLVLENFIHLGYRLQRVFKTLGNLTYATYLIHIPSQIVLLVCIQKLGMDQLALATNEYFFVLWFFMLHIVSFLIYISFEIPLKKWIISRVHPQNKPE